MSDSKSSPRSKNIDSLKSINTSNNIPSPSTNPIMKNRKGRRCSKIKKEKQNLTPPAKRRVRTGCLTCRRKHKKCDENRNPKCDFCTSKGLDCIWPENVKKNVFVNNSLKDFQFDKKSSIHSNINTNHTTTNTTTTTTANNNNNNNNNNNQLDYNYSDPIINHQLRHSIDYTDLIIGGGNNNNSNILDDTSSAFQYKRRKTSFLPESASLNLSEGFDGISNKLSRNSSSSNNNSNNNNNDISTNPSSAPSSSTTTTTTSTTSNTNNISSSLLPFNNISTGISASPSSISLSKFVFDQSSNFFGNNNSTSNNRYSSNAILGLSPSNGLLGSLVSSTDYSNNSNSNNTNTSANSANTNSLLFNKDESSASRMTRSSSLNLDLISQSLNNLTSNSNKNLLNLNLDYNSNTTSTATTTAPSSVFSSDNINNGNNNNNNNRTSLNDFEHRNSFNTFDNTNTKQQTTTSSNFIPQNFEFNDTLNNFITFLISNKSDLLNNLNDNNNNSNDNNNNDNDNINNENNFKSKINKFLINNNYSNNFNNIIKPEISDEEMMKLMGFYIDNFSNFLNILIGEESIKNFSTLLISLSKDFEPLKYCLLALSSRYDQTNNGNTFKYYKYSIDLLIKNSVEILTLNKNIDDEISTILNKILITCIMLTIFEVLSSNQSLWKSKLKICGCLLKNFNFNILSVDPIKRGLFLCFARMDFGSVLISEDSTCLNSKDWFPIDISYNHGIKLLKEQGSSVYYIMIICSKIFNLISSIDKDLDFDNEWVLIWDELKDWEKNKDDCMLQCFNYKRNDSFPEILYPNSSAVISNQLFHMCCILMIQNKPRLVKISNSKNTFKEFSSTPMQLNSSESSDTSVTSSTSSTSSSNDSLFQSAVTNNCTSNSPPSLSGSSSPIPNHSTTTKSSNLPITTTISSVDNRKTCQSKSQIWHAKQILGINLCNMKRENCKNNGCFFLSLQCIWIAGKLISSSHEHSIVLQILEEMESWYGIDTKWRSQMLVDFWNSET
ncbi:hypothetical protein B5S32_g4378 [[Candida] boidinii]|nr:hypothetical protein B5S32_g4378 [[Candida] boidinii]